MSPTLAARVPPTRAASRTQERGDRTRAAIVDETVRCILEEGFAAASARHIAERAGVTWGVIQYHFGDRNGLLAEVVDTGYAGLCEAVAAVSVPEGPVHGRVAAVVDAAWAAFAAPASRAAFEILVATRAERDPARTTELEAMATEMHRLGVALAGGDRGRRARARAVGDVLWAALRGLVLAEMVVREPLDSSRERATLVELIVAALDR